MIKSGLVWQLESTDWDWFCTFTFGMRKEPIDEPGLFDGKRFRIIGTKVPGMRKRFHMFFAWLRGQEKHWKHQRTQWILRHETGELNGRPHFHVLIRALPVGANSRSARFAAMAAWESLGGGMARIRRFNDVDAISYCVKNLDANAYEVGKFGITEETDFVQMSPALLDHLRTIASRSTV